MGESIVVSLIGLIGSAVGAFGGILINGKLTQYRLEMLEKKVEKHNTIIERTYALEEENAVQNERITELMHRVGHIEKGK